MVEKNRYDHLNGYCRMLGHQVPFSYCREPGNRLFCSRIKACWGGKIDMASYLAEQFSPEEIDEALSPPKPKMASLVDLIRSARERTSS